MAEGTHPGQRRDLLPYKLSLTSLDTETEFPEHIFLSPQQRCLFLLLTKQS